VHIFAALLSIECYVHRTILVDFMETLEHFEDISRKYIHGGRRRSVFGSLGSNDIIAKDKEAFTDDYKQNLIATLECVGVVCMNEGRNGRVLTIPFEQVALRDVVWKMYIRTTKGEAKSRAFITEFFSQKEPSLRICEELPWHFKVRALLVSITLFVSL
jgi:hypothetical protein